MLIYKITNIINGKIYIGKTKGSLNNRMGTHKSSAKRNNDNQIIHKAIRKYGWDNFKPEIVEDEIQTIDLLNKREIFYIRLFNSTNHDIGYNLSTGGGGGAGIFGEAHHNFGKKFPFLIERNKKNKGKTFEEMYGKEKAEELKKNLANLKTETKLSEEAKTKVSNARKKMWEDGVYDKPEVRAKFGQQSKGIPSVRRRKVYSPELDIQFECIQDAATYIGGDQGNICAVLAGRLKTHKGFTFVYVQEKK